MASLAELSLTATAARSMTADGPSTTLSTEWQQHGKCRAGHGHIFFPPAHFEHKPEREAREAKAKAICADCPVRVECLEWALAVREPYGVWGGHSELERKQILMGKRRVR